MKSIICNIFFAVFCIATSWAQVSLEAITFDQINSEVDRRDSTIKALVAQYDFENKSINNTGGIYCTTLDATLSVDEQNPHLIYKWDFEGKKKDGLIVDHCFSDGGYHDIYLTTYDTVIGYDTRMDTTLSLYFHPLWGFDHSGGDTIKQFATVIFYADSYSGESPSTWLAWDFGDKRYAFGSKVRRGFNNQGINRVLLYILDENDDGVTEIKHCIYQDVYVD